MNATPLEMARLVVMTFGMCYVGRNVWQAWKDYLLLKAQRIDVARVRINAWNGVMRATVMVLMWLVALLAVFFATPWPSAWATFAQASYTVVGVLLVVVARNIRKAQSA